MTPPNKSKNQVKRLEQIRRIRRRLARAARKLTLRNRR